MGFFSGLNHIIFSRPRGQSANIHIYKAKEESGCESTIGQEKSTVQLKVCLLNDKHLWNKL